MQYFTFLGLGDYKKGYSDIIYNFEDNLEEISISKFIQEPIINRYKNSLDKVHIFVTKESKERYEDELSAIIGNEIELEFILIDMGIQFETFVAELISRIEENQHVIIDITHSFRHIPMKLLFAIKYIEMSKNAIIDHLYYGKLQQNIKNGESDEGIIIDLIKDYKLQNYSSLLYQFDKSLSFSIDEMSLNIETDQKISKLLESLRQFNHMIEYCEFDRCIKVINLIIENCKSIQKEANKYTVIIPFIDKINGKFESFTKCKNNTDRFNSI